MPELGPPEEKTLIDWVTDARTVLAALGLLLFAVLRIAYSRFYGELGLTPDDLGLGYVELLVQSAVGAIGLLIAYTVVAALVVPMIVGAAYSTWTEFKETYPLYFLAAVPGLFVVPVVGPLVAPLLDQLIQEDRAGRLARFFGMSSDEWTRRVVALKLQKERRERRRATTRRLGLVFVGLPIGVLALLAALGVISWQSFGWTVLGGVLVYGLAGLLVGIVQAVVVGTRWIGEGLRGRVTLAGQSAQPWFRAGVGLVLAFVMVGGAATLLLVAAHDAREVRGGNPARFEILGVRVTSWGADEAQLDWTTDKIDPALKPLSDQCLLYLAQANQTIFVRSEHGASFRVPASVASIRIADC